MEATPGSQECPCRDARGQRQPEACTEGRFARRLQPGAAAMRRLSRVMPCGRSSVAVQALLLTMLLLAEDGQSRRGVAEGLSDSPLPGKVAGADGLTPEEAERRGPCPAGHRFISFDGSCERDISVRPRTRLIAMSIATLIGVGVPVLFCLLLATCHIGLWDDLTSMEEVEEDEKEGVPKGMTQHFEKVNSLGKGGLESRGALGPPEPSDQEPATAGYVDYANSPSRRVEELSEVRGETKAEAPRRPPSNGRTYGEYDQRPCSSRKPSNCGVESWLISISAESGPDYGGSNVASSCSATPV